MAAQPHLDDDSPLNDPDYQPKHPPVDGVVPDVVRRWGKRSQLRWFWRFWREVNYRIQDITDMWVDSEHHRDRCCGSCLAEWDEEEGGRGVCMDGWCCCHDKRLDNDTIGRPM